LKRIFFASFFLCAYALAAECPVAPITEGPVSYYGKLKVREGRPFIDGIKEGGDTVKLVQVRGVSFFWSQWGGSFYNANAVERMAKDWKAEIVRAAYGQNDDANKQRIKVLIDAAIENDIYVIIDWHSHSAHNQTAAAGEFFAEIAQTYGKCNGVIFELYNEPLNVDWAGIKTYAEAVIPIIREHSDNLILVGTPNYSQKVQDVIGNAIDDKNVGYVLHFYSASHILSSWRNNIDMAISNNLPIFVTEYGTTNADGGCSPEVSDCNGGNNYNSHNTARSNEWHVYLDSKKISSVAWSVFDKYEGSAFFGTVPRGSFDQTVAANWADTTEMTESGKYIFKKLNCYYLSLPWNPNPSQPVLDFDPCSQQNPTAIKAPLAVNSPQYGNIVIEVFSLQGKKVGKFLSFADINLKNGVYIFILRQNGAIQTKKMYIYNTGSGAVYDF
jgi:hypothetical protein